MVRRGLYGSSPSEGSAKYPQTEALGVVTARLERSGRGKLKASRPASLLGLADGEQCLVRKRERAVPACVLTRCLADPGPCLVLHVLRILGEEGPAPLSIRGAHFFQAPAAVFHCVRWPVLNSTGPTVVVISTSLAQR